MTYLISGATGFIGRRLVRKLLQEEQSVHYMARARGKSMDTRAAYHCWDAGAMPPLNSVPRTDTIVQLAGEPVAQRWTDEVKKKIYESRVDGTRRLVSAIGELKHKPKTLICASAIGYYGNRGDELLTESSAPGTGFLAKVCVDWEQEAAKAREFGLRVVSIRIGVVLGPDGGALQKMLPIFRLGLGGRFGNGRQWMSWIHVDDLVRMIVFAAENESIDGPVNGTTTEPVTNAEFTAKLAKSLHRPAIFTVPGFVLNLALGEMSGFLMDSTRVVSAAAAMGFAYDYPELSGAFEHARA